MVFATIRRGASQDGFFAVPVEGSSFYIPESQLSQFSLHEGDELSLQQFESLRQKIVGMRLTQKALDYLAMREHTRKELELKLRMKEFPSDMIVAELDRLETEKYLSDERFAEQFVASRQRKNPEGSSLLLRRLQQKGVDRTVAAEVLSRWFSDEDAVNEAMQKACMKLLRKGADQKEQIRQLLFRKGFSSMDISSFMERFD